MNTDKFPFKKIIPHTGESFSASQEARKWLKEGGYTLGIMCADEPQGIVKGDIHVHKWRNLSNEDRASLDGVATSDNFRDGDITIHLKSDPG